VSDRGTGSHTVGDELAGVRLDHVVRALFDASWGRARGWIERGKISVDGLVVTDPAAPARRGAAIAFEPAARRPARKDDLDLARVVHVDDLIVVVDKPSGISTVPFGDEDDAALCHHVQRFLSRRGGPRPARRRSALHPLLVVHRLDRGTSGLLVFARTRRAFLRLADQFREHSVHRRYRALAHGHVRSGTFRSHLLEDRGDGLRGSVERSPLPRVRRQRAGKIAVTHVELEEYLRGDVSIVTCRLETGRTAQIRIHLSEAGHPLVGETLYLRDYQGEVVSAPRLMLHAGELGFVHPGSGEWTSFTRPVPDEMQAVIERLRAGR
jgi:23S rRNA pseudouridine1911/1915/1917 synthase